MCRQPRPANGDFPVASLVVLPLGTLLWHWEVQEVKGVYLQIFPLSLKVKLEQHTLEDIRIE